jgi:acyl carrier protein
MSAVFGIDAGGIGPDSSPVTIAEWDSVGHLQLMLALEDEFGVQFEADEFAALTSVGVIVQRLDPKHARG